MLNHFAQHRKANRTAASRHARVLPLSLETLEYRRLLSAVPVGSVDILSRTSIVGWAYDADDAAGPVNIQITVNGSPTTVQANQERDGLIALFGSPFHAFSYTMPTLAPGNSTVTVQAISPSTGASVLLKSTTLTNPPPVGWMDVTSATQIAGWAYDPDSTSPIQIRIDVNGVAGTPFTTNVARPPVTTMSGVSTPGFNVSGSFAGQVVEVYAIDTPSGQATLLWTNNRTPTGWVDVNDGYTVSGWAVDPDNTSASINVQVKIDGTLLPGTPVAASLSRPGLIPMFGSANHGFSITIPGVTPGTHTISVYAIDGQATSAAPVLLSSKTITDAPPIGNVDIVNASQIVGWALDPDVGAASINITVYVDDTVFATVPANISRPGLTPIYGSPNHGFSVDLSSVPPGSHSISVTASDNRVSNQSDVVIFDDFINNHQPIGYLDAISNNTIVGWAQDPDTPTSPIYVDIYVDGAYSTTTTANITRPGLVSVIGSANHAFSVTLPALSFGSHKIDAYAAESQGNVSTLIGTQTVTNNRPNGWLDVVNATTVAGWAYDSDTPAQSISIKVYINGVLAVTGSANVTRNELVPIIGSANHGFAITLPTLSTGRNQIDVYAVDTNNGSISILGSGALTV